MAKPSSRANSSDVTAANVGLSTVAGGGGGTLLAAFANNLSNDDPFKSWLLIIAPVASVAMTAFWIWLQARITRILSDREADAIFSKAELTLTKALEDGGNSSQHQAELRKQLEELRNIRIQGYVTRLRVLAKIEEISE